MCRACRKSRRGGYNRGRAGGGRPAHITEELLAEARRLYARGLSLRQVAAELHPGTGYQTVASCAEALYGHFKRRGWNSLARHDDAVLASAEAGHETTQYGTLLDQPPPRGILAL
jgi:hypothetical protein